MSELSPTPRTRLTREKERGASDRAELMALLGESIIAHIGVTVGEGVASPAVEIWSPLRERSSPPFALCVITSRPLPRRSQRRMGRRKRLGSGDAESPQGGGPQKFRTEEPGRRSCAVGLGRPPKTSVASGPTTRGGWAGFAISPALGWLFPCC